MSAASLEVMEIADGSVPVQMFTVHHGSAELSDLDEVWGRRYIERDLIVAVAHDERYAALPEQRIMRAFLAWRESRLSDALELVLPAIESGLLPPRWSARARNIHSMALSALGLSEEALRSLVRELEDARAGGDPVDQALTLHNLAVNYELTDPERAVAQYYEAFKVARSLLSEPGVVGLQAHMLTSMAITNLRIVSGEAGVPVPDDVPDLADAERLAAVGWPEASFGVAAMRALELLDEGDEASARALVDRLPDLADVRDVDNREAIARAVAAMRRRDGDLVGARDLLAAVAPSISPGYRFAILESIASLQEEIGDVTGALQTTRELLGITRDFFLHESRLAVRALEVQMRTVTLEEAARAAQETVEDLRSRVKSLHAARQELADQLERDPLTGLWNREHIMRLTGRLDRDGVHEVAVVDVDRFKSVNDGYGHAVGDAVLCLVADALRDATEAGDVVARLGGDEFVVVRPAHPGRPATGLAPALAAASWITVGAEAGRGLSGVSLSVGVASVTDGDIMAAIDRADRGMYRVKRDGGGGVRDAERCDLWSRNARPGAAKVARFGRQPRC